MRGLPPLQALVLLLVLAVLGYAGSRYIDMGDPITPAPHPETEAQDQTIEAEIELVFSSPPLSYSLTKPSVSGGEDELTLQSSTPIENPSYGNVKLVSHQPTTYWLDVVWPADAKEGAHHFVQLNINPSHGDSQQFSFFSSTSEMNETFEFQSGEHAHE